MQIIIELVALPMPGRRPRPRRIIAGLAGLDDKKTSRLRGEPPLPDEAYAGIAESEENMNKTQKTSTERSLCLMDVPPIECARRESPWTASTEGDT